MAPVLLRLICHTALQPIGCRRCPAASDEQLLEPQDFSFKLHEHFNVITPEDEEERPSSPPQTCFLDESREESKQTFIHSQKYHWYKVIILKKKTKKKNKFLRRSSQMKHDYETRTFLMLISTFA